MSSYGKTVKNKKVDKETNLKITNDEMTGRILVEFSSLDHKLVVQKSFQDNYLGNIEAEEFQGKIKSISDLRNYFGFKGKK